MVWRDWAGAGLHYESASYLFANLDIEGAADHLSYS